MATFRWSGVGFVPADGIALTDRGFRYGMMVFETIAVRSGRLVFLEEHLTRLRSACETTGLHWPDASAALPPVGIKQGVARLYVTAGPGAIDAPFASEVFFTWEDRSGHPPAASYRLHDQALVALPPFPGLKTGNYWANARALATARGAGFDEAVLTSPAGHVTGAAMANLFAKIDGELTTPSLASGARDGVTRAWIMARRQIRERELPMVELMNASEIFLTSSGIGVMPVSRFGARPLPPRVAGEKLRREFLHETER